MSQRLPSRSVFLTGATGFIGGHVAARLSAIPSYHCTSLQRTSRRPIGDIRIVTGDLLRPSSYVSALRGCDLVVHMAAVTGKARPAEYASVNVDGTRALVEACVDAGVSRFVLVSSIAATFRNTSVYHYAASKQGAEAIVRGSGLEYAIVRPTIVFGRESPIWRKLRALAGLPVMPIFGNGLARVQPIHVDDVVAFLLSMIEAPTLPNRPIDLGGPESLTFERLLRKIRRLLRGSDSRVVRIPVAPIITMLAVVESSLYPVLPVTAGQLSAFVTDSVAADDPLVTDRHCGMLAIDDMLRTLLADE